MVVFYFVVDVMLVMVLCDGMNFVVKEYIVICVDNRGVLVFSEFMGVVDELCQVVWVNLYDIVGLKDVIMMVIEMLLVEQVWCMCLL